MMRGLFNAAGVEGRARTGALTTEEAIGRRVVQAPAAMHTVATATGAQMVRIAERAK